MKDVIRHLYDHVEGVVRFGDTKATLLIAADALLVTAYLTAANKLGFFEDGIEGSAKVLCLVAFALLGLSLVLALVAATPNPSHWLGKERIKSVLLYSSIAGYDENEYLVELQRLGDEDISDEIVRQIHSKARFAHRKFSYLALSSTSTCLSFIVYTTAIFVKVLS
jgi:hypothetical protein